MAYNSKITTSKHGRLLGLQNMSSAESGGNHGNTNLLVGPEDLRMGVTTAETTDVNLKSYGVSGVIDGVYTLDPPIPGVRKVLHMDASGGTAAVKTANNETILTTAGSSNTTLSMTTGYAGVELVGFTTAIWTAAGIPSSVSLATST